MITRESLENAAAAVVATGGSTNGVLHLLAIARELGIEFTLRDFDEVASRTPVVMEIKPAGRFFATDVHAAGGVALVGRELQKRGLVHAGRATVDGRTLGEIADAAVETPGSRGDRPDRDADQGERRAARALREISLPRAAS